jgi:MGT family glycosyltransferase
MKKLFNQEITFPERPLKILFANYPADGHFNPLTSLAIHLKNSGHEISWYTSKMYEEKVKSMGINFYPFKKALEYNSRHLEVTFPERVKYKNPISKLNFDLQHLFILRSTEYLEDIKEIEAYFSFDLLIADISFTGAPLIKKVLKKPVITVGVVPLIESSKDLPPYGMALTPAASRAGKRVHSALRYLMDNVFFGKSHKLFRNILHLYGIETGNKNLFDIQFKESSLVLQNGTPGFEYYRSDISPNVRFLGPLLPAVKNSKKELSFINKLKDYKKVILVTQGTVEYNTEKILIPTLEAFKNSNYLVVVATGGNGTAELKKQYPQANIVIEDFIPFDDIMPQADVYVTNGGYGGVLMSINNKLPMVVAGVHEGKNEIAARVGYFKLGINLKTEHPKPEQIRKSVEKILSDKSYKENVLKLQEEFSRYSPQELCEHYVYESIKMHSSKMPNRRSLATSDFAKSFKF